jgi:hypothetical protein
MLFFQSGSVQNIMLNQKSPRLKNRVVSSKFAVTLRLTASQYVLVLSALVGLATRYYLLSECCCLKCAALHLWGAVSDERTRLQFAV